MDSASTIADFPGMSSGNGSLEAPVGFGELFDHAADAMVVVNDQGCVLDANAAICELLGMPRERVVGQILNVVLQSQIDLKVQSKQESAVSHRFRHWLERRDGTRRFVEASISMHVTPGRHLAIYRDVSELYLLEKELVQAEKRDSLARLASGFSHDFTNLLNIIGGHAELLIREFGPDPRLQRHTDSILAAVKQATILTSQLSEFEGQRPLTLELLDLNSITLGLRETLRNLAGVSVRLETRQSRDPLPKISADRTQMGQILLTLVASAKDAIVENGSITIEIAHSVFNDVERISHIRIPAGEYVILTVHAVPDKAQNRSEQLSPNPVKREEIKLPLVYGSLLANQAYMIAETPACGEVLYQLYFPIAQGSSSSGAPQEDSEDLCGNETVLLVDDEIGLRETTAGYLRSLGYKVLRAGNGEQALPSARSEKIDILVTDLRMPKMSGKELAACVRKEKPGIKVIYVTAAADREFVREIATQKGSRLLLKPFAMRQLARTLREVLDENRRGSQQG